MFSIKWQVIVAHLETNATFVSSNYDLGNWVLHIWRCDHEMMLLNVGISPTLSVPILILRRQDLDTFYYF